MRKGAFYQDILGFYISVDNFALFVQIEQPFEHLLDDNAHILHRDSLVVGANDHFQQIAAENLSKRLF
jgi:hypothetical protein